MSVLIGLGGFALFLFLVFCYFYYVKVLDLAFFLKKYRYNDYGEETWETRLRYIAREDSPFPIKDKKKALRTLKILLDDKESKEAALFVKSFTEKYPMHDAYGDEYAIYNLLKEVASDSNNPAEDREFANDMMKSIDKKKWTKLTKR